MRTNSQSLDNCTFGQEILHGKLYLFVEYNFLKSVHFCKNYKLENFRKLVLKMFNVKILHVFLKHALMIYVVDLQYGLTFGSSRSDVWSWYSLFSSSQKANPHTEMNSKMSIIFISIKDL